MALLSINKLILLFFRTHIATYPGPEFYQHSILGLGVDSQEKHVFVNLKKKWFVTVEWGQDPSRYRQYQSGVC